jgi:hypothetical protein
MNKQQQKKRLEALHNQIKMCLTSATDHAHQFDHSFVLVLLVSFLTFEKKVEKNFLSAV